MGLAAGAIIAVLAGRALHRTEKTLVDEELQVESVNAGQTGGVFHVAGLAGDRDEQAGKCGDAEMHDQVEPVLAGRARSARAVGAVQGAAVIGVETVLALEGRNGATGAVGNVAVASLNGR